MYTAEAKKVLRITLVGMELASQMFGIVLAPTLVNRIHQDSAVSELAREIKASIFREQEAHKLATYLRLAGSARGKVLIALTGALTPTTSDYSVVRLPSFLYLLYYIVRPLRVVLKYAIRIVVSVRRGYRYFLTSVAGPFTVDGSARSPLVAIVPVPILRLVGAL